ncbi:MAG TPA: class I SAM-dependent methyltransferase, partial [Actinomycetota bacterium]|nr:class I SAM-dependent methyltransferase [Actinomycetota bacterium]
LARARAELIPPARPGDVLLDVGCGGGLMAPHVQGYAHVGVDITASALRVAAARGIVPVQADAGALPFSDGVAAVVVAGEVFEHVRDLDPVVAEVARVLRPGGVLLFDTINDTAWARVSLVTIGERMPGGPPPRIHDPALFVSPAKLTGLLARHGVRTEVRGLRPSVVDYVRFLVARDRSVRMLPSRFLGGLYQGRGIKAS